LILGPVVTVAGHIACGLAGIGFERGFKGGFLGADDAFAEEDLVLWDVAQKEVDED
jgi:hypothetical protein